MSDGPRIALVTGANRGIGREVVRQLAQHGHLALLGARHLERGRRTARELAGEGLRVDAVPLDVTDPDGIDRLRADLSRRHGHLDILVNNAGIHYDKWQQASAADLRIVAETFDTNLMGAWRTTLALLPLLRASGRARIVNVSSGVASLSTMNAGTPAYRVSKVALNALTRMLAAELRPEGILVNAVCPGWVATDMGGPGGRPVGDGAAGVVWAAELPDGGPSGGFFRDGRPLPW